MAYLADYSPQHERRRFDHRSQVNGRMYWNEHRFDVYGAARYAPTNERGILGSMLDCRNVFGVMVAADGGLERAII